MLTYSFSDIGNTSLYEHLYHSIKKDIVSGTLKPQDRLPSKRSFAKHLNISTITIENAYAQLLAEGYIYSLPKKGYYVSDITELVYSPKSDRLPTSSSSNASSSALKQELGQGFSSVKKTLVSYQVDFASNQTCAERFPFATWMKLMREIMAEKSTELMINPPGIGIPELRTAIAEHLQQFRGMQVSPEQVIIGAGTEYLYGLLIQLLGREKVYAIENPGYTKIARIYTAQQVTVRHLSMDSSGICMKELEQSDCDILHISPTHHFPTGIVTSINRRNELLNWAAASDDRYIIEDDYDCEFRLMGKPIRSLQSLDQMEKVIYINTFTKSLTSTIRISYMVLPPHLMELFQQKLGFYSATVSNFEQYTLAKFLREGYFEKHINRMRKFYRNQRDELLSCIKKSPLSSKVTITEEDAGLHFLLRIQSSLTEEQIQQKAAAKGLRISSLSQFYHGTYEHTVPTFLINYSALRLEQIPIAVELLGQCI